MTQQNAPDPFDTPENIRVMMELASETAKIKSITNLPDVNQAERECYRAGYAEGLAASGEALLKAERQNENLREGIARTAGTILIADAKGELTDDVFKKAFEWLRDNGQHSDFIADAIRERAIIKQLLGKYSVAVLEENIVLRIKFALELLDARTDELRTLRIKFAGEI